MKKRAFLILLVFLFAISSVNGFNFYEDSIIDITGNAVRDGSFFDGIINFFRGLLGMEPIADPIPFDIYLTVLKTGLGSGTVTSNPTGIDCGIDCMEDYISGTSVILTATPETGSTFSHWEDNCSGTGTTCTVNMNSDKTATAKFSPLLIEVCNDEIDNDRDGETDCEDEDCHLQTGPSGESCEYGQELTCNDNYDNDADGYTDCDDITDCEGEINSLGIECKYCECNEINYPCDAGETCQEPASLNECEENVIQVEMTPVTLNGLCVPENCDCNSDSNCDIGESCDLTSGCEVGTFSGFCVEDPTSLILSISPSTLNFGSVEIGEQTNKTLIISNNGQLDLFILFVVPDNISISLVYPNLPASLPASGQEDLNFSFAPTIIGSYSGEILISTNYPNQFITAEYTGLGIGEDCTDGVDNDNDGDMDCEDSNCYTSSPLYVYEYVYEYYDSNNVLRWDCSNGKKSEKNFTDDMDNDDDGIIDGLDADCTTEDCSHLNLDAVDVSGGSEFWEGSSIDEIDCSYNLEGESDSTSIRNCLNLTLGGIYGCGQPTLNNNVAEYYNCYLENLLGGSEIECSVLDICNSNERNQQISIQISEYNTCSGGVNIGLNYLSVFNLESPENGEDAEVNETLEIEIKIKYYNPFSPSDEKTFKAKAELVDMDDVDPPEKSVTSSSLTLSHLDTDSFEFNMTVPADLDIDNNYRLYYKVYESGNEDTICVSDSIALNILEAGCPDEDEDGYEDESCGGSDCNDDNDEVNTEAAEICNDFIDNDCDGLTDNADSNCQPGGPSGGSECNPSWSCTSWSPEPCSAGQSQTRACTDINFCNNLLNKPLEIMSCPGAGAADYGSEDSDSDGLPDEWEYTYFGNLAQGPNNDFDNDGYTNAQEFSMSTNPKTSDAIKGDSGILNTILIALGVLVLAGLIIFIYFKMSGRKKISKSPRINPALVNYVKQSREAGLADAEIRKKLTAAGWKSEEIDKVL